MVAQPVDEIPLPAAEEIGRICDDPREFVSRLCIRDSRNRNRRLVHLWPEQVPWLDALVDDSNRYVIGLKPRQVGYTTVTQAYQFWKAYTANYPHRTVTVAHEDMARLRAREMIRVYHETLPPELQFGFTLNNSEQTRFAHNDAGFDRLVAGARGQGRAFTYNDLHATEMGKWPRGTASGGRADDEAGAVDETVFASLMATMHDQDGKVIVESTGDGPDGLFYNLWQEACEPGSKWARVFVSWSDVERYREVLTDEQAQALEKDLDDDEARLRQEFGLSLDQLAWRRTRMRTQKWNALRFRREFPLTDAEPFLVTMAGWFDSEKLNAQMLWSSKRLLGSSNEALRIFHPFEEGRKYYMGVDTCGGVGRDWSVIHVLRDDLVHCATWSSNIHDPVQQAVWVARLGRMYGKPRCVIEANNHGMQVIKRASGVVLWKDPKGKDFWSSGGRAGDSKRDAVTHAREVIDAGHIAVACSHTIRQLMRIVEKPNGKIEGAGNSHDDFAMALVFALWAARGATARMWRDPAEVRADRIRTIQNDRRFGG